MVQTISSKQTGVLLLLFTIALKLSALPAITYIYSGKDSWIVCLIASVIEFAFTVLVIVLIYKLPHDKTFFKLISETLSKPIAIILYILFATYFLAKSIVAIQELHDYFLVSLFEEINPIFFLLAFAVFLIYVFNREFRTMARVTQVCFWPLALGILFTLIYPLTDIDIVNLLPILANGSSPLFKGLYRISFVFGDFMLLFMLMGHIKFDKKGCKTILFYMSIALNFIVNFFLVFVGSFGNTAVNKALALSELPLHNPYPATVGKLEWLTIILWTIILLMDASLLGKCSCYCIKQIFNAKNYLAISYVVTSIITITIVLSYLKLTDILKYVTSSFVCISSFAFQTITLISITLGFIIYKKREKSRKNV